ncbi:hypothetical protein CYLTODRAFT_427756 [Cylindrobasidium torrendii FP15055 ss-10]|uniref:Uncharacterized protein n=1 Tax=Cylindrobasidium torrendii FP15055 ss-10 TaxID=1314674 RepID=A0A0D7ARN5_9AGAR|nr:hypothetical protein CYLTODRAFT_427756 [Cylindrobasidium torrendii FP15055 ss-10]
MNTKRTRNTTKLLGEEKTSDNMDSNPLFTALDRLEAEKRQKKREKKVANTPMEDDIDDFEEIEILDRNATQEDRRKTQPSTSAVPVEAGGNSPPRLTAAEKKKGRATDTMTDTQPETNTNTETRKKTLAMAIAEYIGTDIESFQQRATGDRQGRQDNAPFKSIDDYKERTMGVAETLAYKLGCPIEEAEPLVVEAVRRWTKEYNATGVPPNQALVMGKLLEERGYVRLKRDGTLLDEENFSFEHIQLEEKDTGKPPETKSLDLTEPNHGVTDREAVAPRKPKHAYQTLPKAPKKGKKPMEKQVSSDSEDERRRAV